MKPFSLEAAKRGEPIVTRDGRNVKFVAYVPEARKHLRIIVIDESGYILAYPENGVACPGRHNLNDLFMAPPLIRSINGYEYPEPVREPLKIGTDYWCPF